MLLEKLSDEQGFTGHEKEIARFVLKNLDKVPEMSADELAHASYSSKATVVRMCQKLGLKGYHEFRLKLLAEINQKDRIDQMLQNEPITDKSTYEDIVQKLPVLYDKAVTNTKLSLNKNVILRIFNYLKRAESIDIYGMGISYFVAQSAAFKFATLGVECSAYESINAHYLAARKEKKTVAFLISFTGSNRSIQLMARYLRESTKNYVVGILGPRNGELRKWCHSVVEIPNRDALLSLDVISSFSAATYALDIFFALLLSEKYQEHAKSSVEMLNHGNLLWESSFLNESEEKS